jgi:hypothetical protein
MHDRDLAISPAQTLLNSPGLQRIGWIPEAAVEGLRLHLGMPYIKRDIRQLILTESGLRVEGI